MSKQLKKPQEPETVSLGHCRYNGRDYYGTGMGGNGDAHSRSELDYLRDWKRWAEQELSCTAWCP